MRCELEYWKDNLRTLYCGDARHIPLEDETAQMCCTSPPYWGLRKYSGVPDLIWGGDEDCQHEWGKITVPASSGSREGSHLDGGVATQSQVATKSPQTSAFCSLCGAWKGSYGLEPTPEMYVQHTVEILREVRRVLRKDGVVFWNIGDSYASGKGTCFNPGGGKGSFSGHGDRKDSGAYPLDRGNVSKLRESGLKPKDLVLIPFRVAIAAQEDGWYVRSVIIWDKPNPMPESVKDRPTNSHEYILMLTKSGKAVYWTHRDGAGTRRRPKADWRWVHRATGEEVDQKPEGWQTPIECQVCAGSGWEAVHLGLDVWQDRECPECKGEGKVKTWKRINLWQSHDYYWDQEAVREPQSPTTHSKGSDPTTTERFTAKSAGAHKDWHEYTPDTILPNGRNIRSVWTFPTQSFPDAHFAVFPEKLPETCIKAATPEVGCCSKCGAPWTRVIEITGHVNKREPAHVPDNTPTKVDSTGWGPTTKATDQWQPTCECGDHDAETGSAYATGSNANRIAKLRQTARAKGGEYVNTKHTTGYQPTCSCAADKVPSIVLDPFAGSGTTLLVAARLGRRAVGVELSKEYCEMAVKRNRQGIMV